MTVYKTLREKFTLKFCCLVSSVTTNGTVEFSIYNDNVLNVDNLHRNRKERNGNLHQISQIRETDADQNYCMETSKPVQSDSEAHAERPKGHKRKRKHQNELEDKPAELNGNVATDVLSSEKVFHDSSRHLRSKKRRSEHQDPPSHDTDNEQISRSSFSLHNGVRDIEKGSSSLSLESDQVCEDVKSKKCKRTKHRASNETRSKHETDNLDLDNIDLVSRSLQEPEFSEYGAIAGVEIDQDIEVERKKKKKKKKDHKLDFSSKIVLENVQDVSVNGVNNAHENCLARKEPMNPGTDETDIVKEFNSSQGSNSEPDDNLKSHDSLSQLTSKQLNKKRKRIRKHRKRKQNGKAAVDSQPCLANVEAAIVEDHSKLCVEDLTNNRAFNHGTFSENLVAEKPNSKLRSMMEMNVEQSTSGTIFFHSELSFMSPETRNAVNLKQAKVGLSSTQLSGKNSKRLDTPRPPLFLARHAYDPLNPKHIVFESDNSSVGDQDEFPGLSAQVTEDPDVEGSSDIEHLVDKAAPHRKGSDFLNNRISVKNSSSSAGNIPDKSFDSSIAVQDKKFVAVSILKGSELKSKNVTDDINEGGDNNNEVCAQSDRLPERGSVSSLSIQERMMDMSQSSQSGPRKHSLLPETKNDKRSISNPFANAQVFSRKSTKKDSSNIQSLDRHNHPNDQDDTEEVRLTVSKI